MNPGPIRTAMRAQAMPGEDPETLKTPADIAPRIVALFDPAVERHGMIYDFPQDAFLERPKPVVAE